MGLGQRKLGRWAHKNGIDLLGSMGRSKYGEKRFCLGSGVSTNLGDGEVWGA